MRLLAAINSLIFLVLSALHIYWAFGGRWGWGSTLPSKSDGQFLFKPGLLATLLVAFGLLLFALTMFGNFGTFDTWIDRQYFHIGIWAIAFIFLMRAIGDFNYIGFTKKIKHTSFANNDTKIYSPLCLAIAVMSFLIVFSKD